MLAIFGLNKEVFNGISQEEKNRFLFAIRVFLVCGAICLIAGIRFMYQLSDSYLIGLLGGILVGTIVFSVVRIALITLISRPLLPLPDASNNQEDAPSVVSKFRKTLPTLPSFSVCFRFGIILLMAVVVALPAASLLLRGKSRQLLESRRNEVKTQFLANHPELSEEKKLTLETNLQKEHFPIHVYRSLALFPAGIFIILANSAFFLFPFFSLLQLRNGKQFNYAEINRKQLLTQIESEYSKLCEQTSEIQKKKFQLSNPILPNQCWIDAPFNTQNVADKPQYTFEDQKTFFEYLKSI
jgi:hypothetical protein